MTSAHSIFRGAALRYYRKKYEEPNPQPKPQIQPLPAPPVANPSSQQLPA